MEESVITGIFQNPKDIRIKNQLSDAFNNNMPSKFLLQHFESTHFLVVHSLSHVQRFATPWTAASQVSLSFTVSWSQLTFMSIESMMLSNHLILCCSLLFLPSIFPSIKVFSRELAPLIRWPKYQAAMFKNLYGFSVDQNSSHPGIYLLKSVGIFFTSYVGTPCFLDPISSPFIVYTSIKQFFQKVPKKSPSAVTLISIIK